VIENGKAKITNQDGIKRKILAYLEKADFPSTTGQIAEAVRLNWYSADAHLAHLKAEKKVFHKRVGRQNQWWTEKVDEQRKRIREQEKIIQEKDIRLIKKDEKIEEQAKEIKRLKERIRELEGNVTFFAET